MQPQLRPHHHAERPQWHLPTLPNGQSVPGRTRRFRFNSLEEVVVHVPGQTILPSFTDLMKRMLQLDSNQPITPRALLEHPFISLERGVQHNSSCPEPSHSSCYPEPSVDHYNSCCPEPSVDTSCPEPNVDHHSSSSCLEKEMMVL
ncbi:Homeodomain-interacting protein kinase 3 [Merluccius polli]|uniref:Homeodomain-interacting protein kinase 3 n=1 Tax=Merluccius polli TaxID=89951 RepID=A0AA47MNB2_MERPO|nr:Homeodomain-interacting protein kinase 3 [Merluccius polli]